MPPSDLPPPPASQEADESLARERTLLAWRRTALLFGYLAALLALAAVHGHRLALPAASATAGVALLVRLSAGARYAAAGRAGLGARWAATRALSHVALAAAAVSAVVVATR